MEELAMAGSGDLGGGGDLVAVWEVRVLVSVVTDVVVELVDHRCTLAGFSYEGATFQGARNLLF